MIVPLCSPAKAGAPLSDSIGSIGPARNWTPAFVGEQRL